MGSCGIGVCRLINQVYISLMSEALKVILIWRSGVGVVIWFLVLVRGSYFVIWWYTR
jgi:hypothetical protein